MSTCRLGLLLQETSRVESDITEPVSAARKMGEKLGPHARVPKTAHMASGPFDRLVVRIGLEEIGNLIRHANDIIGRHVHP